MVGIESAAVMRLLPVAGSVLALCLGMSGCEQAGDTSAEGQKQTMAAPAGSSTTAPAAGQTPAAGTTMSTKEMSPEEISRHFKVKTTDAARAAADAVEASGKKTETAVDAATR
ncbi:MAG: hypothetical protein R3E82_14245 [Pseudomonadales bacterium]|nr:hypothetical protein [Pseudomonadales bacterium]